MNIEINRAINLDEQMRSELGEPVVGESHFLGEWYAAVRCASAAPTKVELYGLGLSHDVSAWLADAL